MLASIFLLTVYALSCVGMAWFIHEFIDGGLLGLALYSLLMPVSGIVYVFLLFHR